MDPEEENEQTRQLEDEARQELEADGCPPCYPPGIYMYEKPDLPEESREIVDYWQSFGRSRGELPLRSQLEGWGRFRAFQRRARAYHFDSYKRKACERRQRHGYDGDVRLTVDLQQQDPRERWIEFQIYHLAVLEQKDEERDKLLKRQVEPRSAEDVANISILLDRAERNVTQHMKLLRWIEQKRQAMMDPGGAVLRASSAGALWKGAQIPQPVLDKRCQDLETQQAIQAGNSTPDSGDTGTGGVSSLRSRHPPSISDSHGDRDDDTDGDRVKVGLVDSLATSTVSRPPPQLPDRSSSPTCAHETPDSGPRDAVPGTSPLGPVLHVVAPDNTAVTKPPHGRKRLREMDVEEKEERSVKTRNTRITSNFHQPRTNVALPHKIQVVEWQQPNRTRVSAYDLSNKPRRSGRCLGLPPEYGLLEEGKAHRAARPGLQLRR